MYAQIADMEARFGADELARISDRAGASAGLGAARDDARVNLALLDASAEIDAHIGRLGLALSPVPALLVALCCDIARWRLYDLRGASSNDAEGVAEPRRRYDRAQELLREIRDGKLSVGDATPGDGTLDPPQPSPNAPAWNAPARVFSDDALRGF